MVIPGAANPREPSQGSAIWSGTGEGTDGPNGVDFCAMWKRQKRDGSLHIFRDNDIYTNGNFSLNTCVVFNSRGMDSLRQARGNPAYLTTV